MYLVTYLNITSIRYQIFYNFYYKFCEIYEIFLGFLVKSYVKMLLKLLISFK